MYVTSFTYQHVVFYLFLDQDVHIKIYSFTPFLANVPILYLLKTKKTIDFLVFSGGIKWEHWPEMG